MPRRALRRRTADGLKTFRKIRAFPEALRGGLSFQRIEEVRCHEFGGVCPDAPLYARVQKVKDAVQLTSHGQHHEGASQRGGHGATEERSDALA